MNDHPMSEGQTARVWRVEYRGEAGDPILADLVPCAVADLKVGDHHIIEGIPGIVVITTAPAFINGQWTSQGITKDEWQQIQDGDATITAQLEAR